MNIRLIIIPFFLLLGCFQQVQAKSSDPVSLFKATDNRAMVHQTQYAYYPESGELRIRLVLANREVKSGRFSNPDVIDHLLAMLSTQDRQLLCVYDKNTILSIAVNREL